MEICDFGISVKTALIKKHMTQKKLSEITDINEKVICDIVHGRNNKQIHKDKICEVLGIDA